MKLTRFVIESSYTSYGKPEKFTAVASFAGPFGDLSVRLSEALLAEIVQILSNEAVSVACANAREISTACSQAVSNVLALTHEVEAS